jgi:hypothetical protein
MVTVVINSLLGVAFLVLAWQRASNAFFRAAGVPG